MEKETEASLHDAVKKPNHYIVGGYECRLVAKALGFHKRAYLFNAFKYLWRCLSKGATERDLRKCKEFIDYELDDMREFAAEEAKRLKATALAIPIDPDEDADVVFQKGVGGK